MLYKGTTIAGWSVVIGAHVLGALSIALYYLGFEEQRAVTVSFMMFALAKFWFVFNLLDLGTSIRHNDVVVNKWMWGDGYCRAECYSRCSRGLLRGILFILKNNAPKRTAKRGYRVSIISAKQGNTLQVRYFAG